MATTQQNDDDLIILTDDLQTESNDEMVINLDSEDKTADDDVILTFDDADETPVKEESNTTEEISIVEDDPFVITTEKSTQDTPVINLEENNKSNDLDLDFGSLDLWDSEIKEEKIEVEAPVNEVTTQEDTLDFGSFDTTETPEEKTDITSEEKTSEVDMDLNFGDLDTQTPENNPEEALIEEKSVEETVSFAMEETTEVVKENDEDSNLGTMETILDETIAKLTKRQDAIHCEEEKQELAISHLEEEIKQLESEKSEAEKKKFDLEAEDKKIKINITQLDKMKAAAEVKPTLKAKK